VPDQLEISIDGQSFTVDVQDLGITYPVEDVMSYGKGYDIIEVLQEGVSTLRGVNIEKEYLLDVSAILEASPIDFASATPSHINDQYINCIQDNYNLELNNDYLEKKVTQALINKSDLYLESSDLVTNSDDYKIIEYCNEWEIESSLLKNELGGFLKLTDSFFEDIYSFKLLSDGTTDWEVNNESYLEGLLEDYNKTVKIEPRVDEYTKNGNDIYLFGSYTYGSEIDIQNSVTAFENWDGRGDTFVVMKDVYEPTFKEANIVDFSNIIAKGETRLSLKVDGSKNPSIPNAEGGLHIIDEVLVQPKQQFSYIKTINAKLKYGSKKYNIGYGTCNSTTTLFRAALEAGFPIDERQSHGFIVDSYGWGYPYNFVDAAYFPNPRVDFKFTNDFDYPVLLNFRIARDDKYQYHIVEVRTSKEVNKRNVMISDWNYIEKSSDKSFTGEFTRVVNDIDGSLIRSETFRSRYR
jgi:vancomycin resistance protein YoaR